MMTLSKETIKSFKKKLLETRAEIEADLTKLKENLDFGSDVDHFEEEADEAEEFSHYLGVKKPLEERLRDINKTLEKIEEGTFGICEKCGEEIEPEVLEVVPESALCKKCKGAA